MKQAAFFLLNGAFFVYINHIIFAYILTNRHKMRIFTSHFEY